MRLDEIVKGNTGKMYHSTSISTPFLLIFNSFPEVFNTCVISVISKAGGVADNLSFKSRE